MTKDADFLRLVSEQGPPPRVLLIALGNTSNATLRAVLERRLDRALEMFAAGEPVVEIRDSAT